MLKWGEQGRLVPRSKLRAASLQRLYDHITALIRIGREDPQQVPICHIQMGRLIHLESHLGYRVCDLHTSQRRAPWLSVIRELRDTYSDCPAAQGLMDSVQDYLEALQESA
jgi:hypothetical protein